MSRCAGSAKVVRAAASPLFALLLVLLAAQGGPAAGQSSEAIS